MQPQQNLSGSNGATDQSAIVCTQFGSPMPKEMRFCRSCGNRLGEGPAEYTETVRFPGVTASRSCGNTTPFYPTFNAPMATVNPGRRRRRLGFAGTTWLWIALVAFFGMGGIMSLARKGRVARPPFTMSAPRSWVGVNQFDTRSEEHTSELQSPDHLVCRLLLEKKKIKRYKPCPRHNTEDRCRGFMHRARFPGRFRSRTSNYSARPTSSTVCRLRDRVVVLCKII